MGHPRVTFRTFIKRIEREIKQHYPHCTVELQTVPQNNGQQLTGITIQEPGCSIVPNLYLESCYEAYMAGRSYEDVFGRLVKDYEKSKVSE